MNAQFVRNLGLFGIMVGVGGVANASILTFDTGQGNNGQLDGSFGSNLTSNIAGANISNGATGDIGLTWNPVARLDLHGSSVWDALDPSSSGVDILQLDLNGGGHDVPTVTFDVAAGVALVINSVDIGHASDQTAPAYSWTITVSELIGGAEVFTTTSSELHGAAVGGAPQAESITINFAGAVGVDYVLAFDQADNDGVRGAIDNLSFSQVPEPGSLALLGLGGLALLRRRRA